MSTRRRHRAPSSRWFSAARAAASALGFAHRWERRRAFGTRPAFLRARSERRLQRRLRRHRPGATPRVRGSRRRLPHRRARSRPSPTAPEAPGPFVVTLGVEEAGGDPVTVRPGAAVYARPRPPRSVDHGALPRPRPRRRHHLRRLPRRELGLRRTPRHRTLVPPAQHAVLTVEARTFSRSSRSAAGRPHLRRAGRLGAVGRAAVLGDPVVDLLRARRGTSGRRRRRARPARPARRGSRPRWGRPSMSVTPTRAAPARISASSSSIGAAAEVALLVGDRQTSLSRAPISPSFSISSSVRSPTAPRPSSRRGTGPAYAGHDLEQRLEPGLVVGEVDDRP